MTEPKSNRRWLLPLRARHALLTAHVIMSVGLLGDSAGLPSGTRSARPRPTTLQVVIELVRVLNMFSLVFGIPLSVGTLLSGLASVSHPVGSVSLSVGRRQDALTVSVMLVGGLVIGPAQASRHAGGTGDATQQSLIAAASHDVLALAVATGLLSSSLEGLRCRSVDRHAGRRQRLTRHLARQHARATPREGAATDRFSPPGSPGRAPQPRDDERHGGDETECGRIVCRHVDEQTLNQRSAASASRRRSRCPLTALPRLSPTTCRATDAKRSHRSRGATPISRAAAYEHGDQPIHAERREDSAAAAKPTITSVTRRCASWPEDAFE